MPSFVLEMLLCWKKCFGGNKKQWGDMENCFFVSNMVSLERKKFPLLWGERAKLGKPEVLILEEFVWLDFSSSITNILDFLDTLNFCSFFLYLYFCLLPFFFFFWGFPLYAPCVLGLCHCLLKYWWQSLKCPLFMYGHQVWAQPINLHMPKNYGPNGRMGPISIRGSMLGRGPYRTVTVVPWGKLPAEHHWRQVQLLR